MWAGRSFHNGRRAEEDAATPSAMFGSIPLAADLSRAIRMLGPRGAGPLFAGTRRPRRPGAICPHRAASSRSATGTDACFRGRCVASIRVAQLIPCPPCPVPKAVPARRNFGVPVPPSNTARNLAPVKRRSARAPRANPAARASANPSAPAAPAAGRRRPRPAGMREPRGIVFLRRAIQWPLPRVSCRVASNVAIPAAVLRFSDRRSGLACGMVTRHSHSSSCSHSGAPSPSLPKTRPSSSA